MTVKKLLLGIKVCYYYILGHIIAWSRYDNKYLTGKYFSGRFNGLCAIGWQWVVNDYLGCKRINVNRGIPWPVSPRIIVTGHQNIEFDPDDLNNFQGIGCYYQAIGKIVIGKGTYIAPNVGLISSNHDLNDPDKRMEPETVKIGKKCWIGMNSMVLPGVTLGDHTVVGAGSVVTKSFTDGYCVIAGNPAKIIKRLDH